MLSYHSRVSLKQRFQASSIRRSSGSVGQPPARVLDVGVAEPGVHLEPGPQPRLGLGIVQVPLVHLAHDVPVDPRVLGGRPLRSIGKRSAPVVHALLEDVAIKRAIIIDTQIQML